MPTPVVPAAPSAPPTLTRAPELDAPSPAAYPPGFAAQGAAGDAVLLVDIDATGAVERVLVQSATAKEFAEAALVAACSLHFVPAEIDGEPAAIRLEYRYRFEPPAKPEVPSPVNFSGLVREAGTRRPIAGATVIINGRALTETDAQGRFEVHGAQAGDLEVRLVALAYEPYTVHEQLAANEVLSAKYYLVTQGRSPFETIVRTPGERREVSKIQLDRDELRHVPGTFGDPVRVIENLPGMARAPGGLGGALLVRGANPADSVVMFDGIEVPFLYHFESLTSVVNVEFLERIDFYPGGFGARYGRATAGVVDVASRDATCDLVRGALKVDVVDSAAFACAPAGAWHTAAAARRSYVDLLLPLALARLPAGEGQARLTVSPAYWDYQAKAGRTAGDHRLDLFWLGSSDRLRLAQSGSAEGINASVGLHTSFHRLIGRDRWRLGPRTSLTTTLSPGLTREDLGQNASDIGLATDARTDTWSLRWREDLSTELAYGWDLNVGLDHGVSRARYAMNVPGWSNQRLFPAPVFDITATQPYDQHVDDYSQAYYAELVAKPWQRWVLVPGLRLERFDRAHAQDLTLLPRLAVRWQVASGTTLKAAYGAFAKLPPSTYLLRGFGNPALRVERAQHHVIGVEQRLGDLASVDVQLYYNRRYHLPSPSSSVVLSNGAVTSENWSSDGTGRAYGLEVLLRRVPSAGSRWYGWVAYTLSRSLRRDHPRGASYVIQASAADAAVVLPYESSATRRYPESFDQTHILTAVGQWFLPWGLEAGFRFRLVSGNPVTPLDEADTYFDADQSRFVVDPNSVERNSSRLPTFDQLDVRIDKTWTLDRWRLTAYLEVINVYNAGNVEAIQYDYRYQHTAPIQLLPIIPVLGIKGDF